MSTSDNTSPENISPEEFKRFTGGLSQEEFNQLDPAKRRQVATKAVDRIIRSQMTPEERFQDALADMKEGIRKITGKGASR
jgi:hypothetical protein